MRDRPFSYRALFAVVYTTSVSSVYFALGVVAHRANGLTPAVFLGRGPVLRADRDDLRRGRLAASRTGRLGRVRPLRVQRAGQLRGRLGDLPRLHDPDRGHRAHRAGVPGRVRRADRAWRARDRGGPRGDRGGGARQPHRRQRAPAASAPADHRRRPDPPGADHRARAGPRVQPARAQREHPPGHRADRGRSRLRAPDRGDRIHRDRGGGQHRRRGERDPQAGQVAGRAGLGGDRVDLRRASRWSGSARSPSTTA